jgi:hypothetical protein
MSAANDIFGDLLDRWRLGRVEKWCRSEWCEEFDWKYAHPYRGGEPTGSGVQEGRGGEGRGGEPVDLLLPGNPWPAGLIKYFQKTSLNVGGGAAADAASAATETSLAREMAAAPVVVVEHLWARIKEHLASKRFNVQHFARAVQEHIDAWAELQPNKRRSTSGSRANTKGLLLHPQSSFVVVLSPTVHEWFFPYFTPDAISRFNTIARSLYSKAGWAIVDAETMTLARPDYRLEMSWWNAQSHLGEKRSGCGVVYAITNAVINAICAAE